LFRASEWVKVKRPSITTVEQLFGVQMNWFKRIVELSFLIQFIFVVFNVFIKGVGVKYLKDCPVTLAN